MTIIVVRKAQAAKKSQVLNMLSKRVHVTDITRDFYLSTFSVWGSLQLYAKISKQILHPEIFITCTHEMFLLYYRVKEETKDLEI